ncbi:hypothetical protein GCM10010924_03480 [Rhizobium wenxiniae]|nr:hypothetical protein GCM10010924_03480 [Rhizobium wenxiniae]
MARRSLLFRNDRNAGTAFMQFRQNDSLSLLVRFGHWRGIRLVARMRSGPVDGKNWPAGCKCGLFKDGGY